MACRLLKFYGCNGIGKAIHMKYGIHKHNIKYLECLLRRFIKGHNMEFCDRSYCIYCIPAKEYSRGYRAFCYLYLSRNGYFKDKPY